LLGNPFKRNSVVGEMFHVERLSEKFREMPRVEEVLCYQVDAPTTGHFFVPTRRRRRNELGT